MLKDFSEADIVHRRRNNYPRPVSFLRRWQSQRDIYASSQITRSTESSDFMRQLLESSKRTKFRRQKEIKHNELQRSDRSSRELCLDNQDNDSILRLRSRHLLPPFFRRRKTDDYCDLGRSNPSRSCDGCRSVDNKSILSSTIASVTKTTDRNNLDLLGEIDYGSTKQNNLNLLSEISFNNNLFDSISSSERTRSRNLLSEMTSTKNTNSKRRQRYSIFRRWQSQRGLSSPSNLKSRGEDYQKGNFIKNTAAMVTDKNLGKSVTKQIVSDGNKGAVTVITEATEAAVEILPCRREDAVASIPPPSTNTSKKNYDLNDFDSHTTESMSREFTGDSISREFFDYRSIPINN